MQPEPGYREPPPRRTYEEIETLRRNQVRAVIRLSLAVAGVCVATIGFVLALQVSIQIRLGRPLTALRPGTLLQRGTVLVVALVVLAVALVTAGALLFRLRRRGG